MRDEWIYHSAIGHVYFNKVTFLAIPVLKRKHIKSNANVFLYMTTVIYSCEQSPRLLNWKWQPFFSHISDAGSELPRWKQYSSHMRTEGQTKINVMINSCQQNCMLPNRHQQWIENCLFPNIFTHCIFDRLLPAYIIPVDSCRKIITYQVFNKLVSLKSVEHRYFYAFILYERATFD